MIWESKTVFVLWGYKPETVPAIKWHKRSDGNWRGSDRGAGEDRYYSGVTFRGPESELTDLLTALDNNRKTFTATFNEGEQLFGAEINYSGALEISVVNYGKIRKTAFKVFELNLKLRLTNPPLLLITGDFSKLRKSSHTDTRDTEFELKRLFTYDQTIYTVDHLSNDGKEAGIFTATFAQTIKEMKFIRRYLLTDARAKKIVFPTFDNLVDPFGPRSGAGPFNCRIIKWNDLGRQDFTDWNLSITFARDLDYWNK